MPTTSEKRKAYPELVLKVTSPPKCDFSKAVTVAVPAGGQIPSDRIMLRVHPLARQAFRAKAAIMLHFGYLFRETAGGTLSCRAITGGTLTTLHAHGIAEDDNPSKNGYKFSVGKIQWGKQTDMSPEMVAAIEAIRTVNGKQVFEWGGRWWNTKDPMHFEIDCWPSDLRTGINLATVPGWKRYVGWETGSVLGGDVIPIDSVTVRPIVVPLQEALNRAAAANGFPGVAVDGKAGPDTARAVRQYHEGSGLGELADGVCFDGSSIAVLLTRYGK